MKRLLPTLLLITFTQLVNAQIDKGTTLVGGSLNAFYLREKINANSFVFSQSGINFNVPIGKAIKKNEVLGLFPNYSFQEFKTVINTSSTTNDTLTEKTNNYGLGFFYRKYFQLPKKLYFFGEANAVFRYGKGKETYEIDPKIGKVKSYNVNASTAIGLGYPIYKKLHAELQLPSFFTVSYNNTNSDSNTRFGERFYNSLQISTGFFSNFLGNTSIGFRLFL
jgi:hypothetical protein